MTEYRLLTIWRIEAPLEEVYAAIHNSPHWPDWWPGMQKVEEVAAGDADGIDSVQKRDSGNYPAKDACGAFSCGSIHAKGKATQHVGGWTLT